MSAWNCVCRITLRVKSVLPFSKLITEKSQVFSTSSYAYLHRNTQIRNRGGTMCPPPVLIGLKKSRMISLNTYIIFVKSSKIYFLPRKTTGQHGNGRYIFYQNQDTINPISTRGGHIVPLLLHICVYLCKYAYELVEKTWLFSVMSLEKGSTLFTP